MLGVVPLKTGWDPLSSRIALRNYLQGASFLGFSFQGTGRY